jgi:hypothetical protein
LPDEPNGKRAIADSIDAEKLRMSSGYAIVSYFRIAIWICEGGTSCAETLFPFVQTSICDAVPPFTATPRPFATVRRSFPVAPRRFAGGDRCFADLH